MSWHAELSEQAQKSIENMPRPLRDFAIAQLKALELNPTLLSHRSSYPITRKCQVFSFDRAIGEDTFLVDVLFQYGADEETIHVAEVSWQLETDSWGP